MYVLCVNNKIVFVIDEMENHYFDVVDHRQYSVYGDNYLVIILWPLQRGFIKLHDL